ncbi:DRBM domain-containing protein [Heracleum sosnowskyi]|uniref:DRBM domain-containing protein n=1 Tax=Heracleum sosnowskyi TaxID=360622 RepID=A0AAD8GN87_9APIA|nr:DRBM domain-containing protein [Heracleum sosnowskyi]
MSSFLENLASMPQPHLLHELHNQLAQNAPPADNQPPPPAQIQAPPPPIDNQAPVAPADNQVPMAPAPAPAQPQLEVPAPDPAPAKPAAPLYKNFLQQFTQKEGLPLPVYQTGFDGAFHVPQFRSTVLVNGESYASTKAFSTRKAAEMDAARIALLSVLQQEDDCSIDQEELIFCKAILKEYADKINAEIPDYKTEKGNGLGFTSSLTFNGKQYVGDEGRNKKESQHLVARAVIMSILDSDARAVISKIIKAKKKMICPKVNNPCNAQNVSKLVGIQTISNVASKGKGPVVVNENIVKTETREPCTGNSSSVSAEPVSLVEASATPNLEQLILGSTSSKKRKRKTKKAENSAGIDAQAQAAAVPLSQNTTATGHSDPASLPGSDNAVLS